MMKAIRSWLIPNPVLVKELRSRMRGPRAFLTLTGALLLMAAMMIGLASLLTRNSNSFGNMLSPQVGQTLFDGLLLFELMLVCTVTPAITAGAISSEREKLTFEMLLTTPLGPASIVWGKLISALSYVFVLIFAAVPLASLVFMFGGIAPLTMLKGLAMLLVVAVTLGIYGLFLSALFARTGRATVAGFVSVMALSVGPLIGMIAFGLFTGARVMAIPRLLLAFSPVSMLISAVTTVSPNNGGMSSLFGFIGGQWDASMNPQALTQIPRPIYHYSLALCGVLSIVLFSLTVGLIHPARRFFLSKRAALTSGALLAFFLALVSGIYLLTAPRYEWVLVSGGTLPQQPQAAPGFAVPKPAQAFAVAVPPLEPTPTPAPPPGAGGKAVTAQAAGWALDEQVAAYSAAIRKAAAGPLYIVSHTDDKAGSPDSPDLGSSVLSAEIQKGLSQALADLSPKLVWVNGTDEVPKEPKTGAIQGGGLLVTLGNLQIQVDGSVQVPISTYQANMASQGQTYRLEKSNGAWQVTGTVGASWIQ